MKLNVTKDQWGSEVHSGQLFPEAEKREFAYQNEHVHVECRISASPPQRRDGKLNWQMEESQYYRYELVIERHASMVAFMLIGHRKDTVAQRKSVGKAVMQDKLIKSLSFGELANLIFGAGCQVFHETEAFPDSVRAAMQAAYPDRMDGLDEEHA